MTEATEVIATEEATKVVVGIKETEEALEAVMEIAVFMAERLSDGIGADDAVAFFGLVTTDSEFKAIIAKAYEGRKLIKEEVKDIDLAEGIVLGQKVLAFVPRLIKALKKK